MAGILRQVATVVHCEYRSPPSSSSYVQVWLHHNGWAYQNRNVVFGPAWQHTGLTISSFFHSSPHHPEAAQVAEG